MVGIVLIYNMYKYMYIYGCGCLTCNYVTIDWAWTPIYLCDTKGITHNGRSQEELDWWLVVGSGCRVVMCCPLSHSWRFLVHLGTPKVSRVGLLLPKYSVLFFCSLPRRTIPTPIPPNFYSFIHSCKWVNNDGNIPPMHRSLHLPGLNGTLS